MKKITCIGYHSTGSGAIYDLLLENKKVFNCTPKHECRFIQDPDGLCDLFFDLTSNKQRLNNCFSIKRYQQFVLFYKRWYKKIFGEAWLNISNDFIKQIGNIEYNAYWHADFRLFSKMKYTYYLFKRGLAKIIPFYGKKRPVGHYNYFPNLVTNYCSLSYDDICNIFNEYIDNLVLSTGYDGNYDYALLDQLFGTNNISLYNQFCKDTFVIIVDRDPRDVYVEEVIKLKNHVLPKDPIKFCEHYVDVRKSLANELKNKNVLFLNFEDLIYKYDDSVSKICDFLSLNINDFSFKTYFNPDKSKLNTKTWLNYPQYDEIFKIIEQKLNDFLYFRS